MPRYFFNIEKRHWSIDDTGTALPDEQTAREAAWRHLGEILKDEAGDVSAYGALRLSVTDTLQRPVIVLSASVETADNTVRSSRNGGPMSDK